MPHEDGAAYAPVVATVSLGASTVLDIYEKKGKDVNGEEEEEVGGRVGSQGDPHSKQSRGRVIARILQEPRSLLVTRGEAYERYLHGIADVVVDEDLGPGTVVNWDMLGDKRAFSRDGDDDVEEEKEGEEEKNKGRNVRGTRISLTFRDVLKVKTMRIGVGGGGGGFLRR